MNKVIKGIGIISVILGGFVATNIVSDIQIILVAVFVLGGLNLIKN